MCTVLVCVSVVFSTMVPVNMGVGVLYTVDQGLTEVPMDIPNDVLVRTIILKSEK